MREEDRPGAVCYPATRETYLGYLRGRLLAAEGYRPGEEVSALLLGSIAGFLAYPPDFLPKSTIFAAYCSHGVLPICAWDRDGAAPPYWRGSGDPQTVATAAHDWYAGHSLARQAEQFEALLAERR